MTNTQSRPRNIGSLRAEAGKGVVRMQDDYATGIEDLWSALTEPDRLSRWLAEVDGDLRIGGTFQASFTSSWSGPVRVDVCERPHRLLVTTNPGQDDSTEIEAVLTARGGGTRLVIEERGLPLSEFSAHGAGWQAHVEDLAAYLAGRTPTDWQTRWTELSRPYERLAAEL